MALAFVDVGGGFANRAAAVVAVGFLSIYGGTNYILRIKEHETRLKHHEHDDDDDDDDDDDKSNKEKTGYWKLKKIYGPIQTDER